MGRDQDGASTSWLGWARGVVGAASVASLMTVTITGVMLARFYVPDGVGEGWTQPPGQDLSRGLASIHGVTLSLSLALTLLWVVVSSAAAMRRNGRPVVEFISGAFAVLAVVVASATWFLIQWDQVALRAVTVGADFRGFWKPAFSDQVGFLLIDGAEVGQSTYAMWMVVHLAGPVVALIALALGWESSRRRGHTDDAATEEASVGATI